MRRGWLSLLFLFFVFAGPSGCDFLGFKTWEWRQRLTLHVETPHGVVSGGSVVGIEVGSSPNWAPGTGAGGMSGRVAAGEASFVEIAPGRYLFALLGNGAEQIPYYTFFPADDKDRERQATELETMRGTREVPRDRWPLLVTFTDIDDPASVLKVDPDNLAASFGPGVALKRITLEITDENVTKGKVETVLGWLDDYYGSKFDGQRYETINAENRLANSLSASNFDTEN